MGSRAFIEQLRSALIDLIRTRDRGKRRHAFRKTDIVKAMIGFADPDVKRKLNMRNVRQALADTDYILVEVSAHYFKRYSNTEPKEERELARCLRESAKSGYGFYLAEQVDDPLVVYSQKHERKVPINRLFNTLNGEVMRALESGLHTPQQAFDLAKEGIQELAVTLKKIALIHEEETGERIESPGFLDIGALTIEEEEGETDEADEEESRPEPEFV